MSETPQAAPPSAPPPEPTTDLFSELDAPESEIAAPETPEPTPAPADASAPPPAAPQAPPAAPASSAGTPSPEPAAAPPATPDRQVPLAVLLEERRKGEERYAALLARTEALEKGAKAPETPPTEEPAVPDFLEDPKGYVDAQLARANAALKKLEEGGTKRFDAVEAQTAETQLSSALVAAEETFKATQPDFTEALTFARLARGRQLEVLNPGMEAGRIAQIVGQEERALARDLVRQGVNPAERVYGLAKAMGYTPKQAAPPATLPAAPINGSAAVVDPSVTLNSTPGTTHSDVEDEEPDMLAQAQQERFGRSRAN